MLKPQRATLLSALLLAAASQSPHKPAFRSESTVVLAPALVVKKPGELVYDRTAPNSPSYSACLVMFSNTPTQANVTNNEEPP